jgi:hypothetical protein
MLRRIFGASGPRAMKLTDVVARIRESLEATPVAEIEAQVRAVAEFAPEFVEIKPWGACGPLAVWIDRRCDTAAVAARLKGAAAAGPAAP